MGSLLGPTLANAFLAHYENIWLEEYPLSFASIFYTRYVEGIFLIFRSSDHITKLAEYFSPKHPTYELEIENILPGCERLQIG